MLTGAELLLVVTVALAAMPALSVTSSGTPRAPRRRAV